MEKWRRRGMAKYTARQIAIWFLRKNRIVRDEADADSISNLKLQKLLYYAQGCYLAITDEPLFDENILAWKHGPVVYEVYQSYKKYGSNGIPDDELECVNVDAYTENILDQVYNVFGQYSAWGLRNMTHQERPWIETDPNDVMKLNLIKEYFKENYIA